MTISSNYCQSLYPVSLKDCHQPTITVSGTIGGTENNFNKPISNKIVASADVTLSEGIAENTIVAPNGGLTISDGSIASKTTVAKFGKLVVQEGAIALDTILAKGASLEVKDGGLARGVAASSDSFINGQPACVGSVTYEAGKSMMCYYETIGNLIDIA